MQKVYQDWKQTYLNAEGIASNLELGLNRFDKVGFTQLND